MFRRVSIASRVPAQCGNHHEVTSDTSCGAGCAYVSAWFDHLAMGMYAPATTDWSDR